MKIQIRSFARLLALSALLYTATSYAQNSDEGHFHVPDFSAAGGVYSAPFLLDLALPPEVEGTVLYTLDGSEPRPDRLDGSSFAYKNQYPNSPGDPFGEFLYDTLLTSVYSGSLAIYDRSSEPDRLSQKSSTNDLVPNYIPTVPSFKGTAVRARIMLPGGSLGPVVTHTYFVSPAAQELFQIPVVAISTDESGFYGYYDGIANAGMTFDSARAALPDMQTLPNQANNYWRRGHDWELETSFELFEPGQPAAALNQTVGVRLHGSSSRRWPCKSLRIYARSSYGNSTLSHKFFDAQPQDDFKRLILHNGGGDDRRANMRDAVAQRIVAPLGHVVQDARAAVVFVNGEFYGVNPIRERYDDKYFERKSGIDPDNLEMVKHENIDHGDGTDFADLISSTAVFPNFSNNEVFENFAERMNVESMRDNFIINIYGRNIDWLPRNTTLWRSSEPVGFVDTKWQFAFVDLDHFFGAQEGYDAIDKNFLADVIAGSTIISGPNIEFNYFGNIRGWFLKSLTNQNFRINFINRFADLMNTLLLPERCLEIIDEFHAEIEPYMPAHVARWSRPQSMAEWNGHVDIMRAFSIERPAHQRQHLIDVFELDGEFDLTLDVSDQSHGYIRVNTVDIHPETAGVAEAPYPWQGIYFRGVPVEVTAVAQPGYTFAGWEGDVESGVNTEFYSFEAETGTFYIKALFEEDPEPQPEAIHYWHFNDLTTNLESVSADVSKIPSATISYPGGGDGYMDDVNDGTDFNIQPDFLPGKALRVRNPSAGRELIVHAPTSGHQSIRVSYASVRTNNGSDTRQVFYRTNPESPWVLLEEQTVYPVYFVYEHDFSQISAAADNPDFALRFIFTGETAAGDNGNNRFDNFLIEGTPIEGWERPLLPLQETTYTLSGWAQHNFPGSYPEYMRFYWSDDPSGEDYDINAPGSAPYDCGYDLDARPRINGLGEAGFSFISTTNPQYDFCAADSAAPHRYTGSAEIGINTQGAEHGRVSWTARLITEGVRTFAVRLQYRTDTAEAFQNIDAPTVFSSQGKAEGDTAAFSLQLPQDLLGLPELYLRWVYYQEEGDLGNRPEIAVDDIEICPCEPLATRQGSRPEALAAYPNPTDETVTLVLEGMEGTAEIFVRDLFGKTVLRSRANPGDKTREVNLGTLAPGVYLISVETQRNNAVVKVVKN